MRVTDTLLEALPLALAIAASPFTVVPAILLLLAPRAAATSSAFLAGWLIGLSTTVTAFAVLAGVIERNGDVPTWASVARVALGLALIALGVRPWLGARTAKPPPAWMASLETATPRRAFTLALVLALANPKVLLLAAGAGLTVGAAELPVAQAAAAIAVVVLVASASVAAPILLYAVLGERMRGPLIRTRDWLVAHNTAVMTAVLTLIGAALVIEGVRALR